MELPAKIQSVIKVDGDGFICCSGKDFLTQFKPHQQKQAFKIFQAILDELGALSAKAQALKQIITSSIKFTGTDHRIYIKVNDNKALGFVKVGQKNLFYRDFIGNIKEMKPTCVLDIYVHQSCQRSGIGKEVFQKFLKHQHKSPEKLAYDRPSQKLLSFLKKHYGLVKFIPQNNNFVIYDRYFSKQLPMIVHEPVQTKLPTLAPQIPNLTTTSQTKLRPRTNLSTNLQKVQKVEEVTGKSYQKIEQKPQPKRQFQQFQKFHIQKHKNNNSQGFPLSIAINDNPTFRTSSGAYGNHYRRKP